MSLLEVILIVLGVLVVLLLIGGFIARRRYDRGHAGDYRRHLAEADRALEEARAADRGWDRGVLEEAVRRALSEARPDFTLERLELVLVDDRPGVAEDRAHFEAVGADERVRVVCRRQEAGHWAAEVAG